MKRFLNLGGLLVLVGVLALAISASADTLELKNG